MNEPLDMVELVCERIRNGKATVSARFKGETVHKDELSLASISTVRNWPNI